ncbi:hypothetical protein ALC62_14043 [Cyphomyrmex costatus]|uniref:DNA-directed DNA polymerase n=1 Tax=Cyphomyrmex costatus TaxID=456900 RepID=A0A151I991_9HYME|nr:hypothetical protein ALC62_14043 [Cyphomyrmex costatus]
MYFDVNNLYGLAMMESLPYGEFQWIDNVDSFDVMSVPIESDIGYILEIDLEYPYMLHDFHVDLPFCPTREIPPGGKRYEKLLATLHAKERYVIHYRNLQQCIRHGLVVTKIHRILKSHKKTEYELGLTNFETYNTIPNVTSSNNKFHFDTDDKVITIPERSYELNAIEKYLRAALVEYTFPSSVDKEEPDEIDEMYDEEKNNSSKCTYIMLFSMLCTTKSK